MTWKTNFKFSCQIYYLSLFVSNYKTQMIDWLILYLMIAEKHGLSSLSNGIKFSSRQVFCSIFVVFELELELKLIYFT